MLLLQGCGFVLTEVELYNRIYKPQVALSSLIPRIIAPDQP